jgi:hypothetical protein
MPPVGDEPLGRAYAHYRWAERYAREGHTGRARAHISRALHYGSTHSDGEFFYTLPQGRLLRRIKNGRNDTDNKFFSFWVDWSGGVDKCRSAYTDRCGYDKSCVEETYIVTRPIELLVVPYKSISMDDVSEYDTRLGAYLKDAAAGMTRKVALFESAVNELVLQQTVKSTVNLDHVLLEGCCALGMSGFVRLVTPHDGRTVRESVEKADMHCYDEVAVCESTVAGSMLRICSDVPPPSDEAEFSLYMSREHKSECIASLAEATRRGRKRKSSKKRSKRKSKGGSVG